jgi:putative ABC transport system permease protein
MMSLSRLSEGVGIALDSLRGNKVRAALTILGVAIGVTVVIAIGATITGINRSVSSQIETLGPKTFFVMRFFQGGINISDGSDEMSPWRRNPWLKVEEAHLLEKLPGVQSVTWREDTQGPVSAGDVNLRSVNIIGWSASWILTSGGTIIAGRNFTEMEEASDARVAVINDKLAQQLFANLDPIGKRLKIFGQPFEIIGLYAEPKSLFGDSDTPLVDIPHSTFVKVADYWKGWMMFAVSPKAEATVPEVQDEVTAALRVGRGLKPGQDNNFALVGQDKLLETWNKVSGGFFIVMFALSGVGLMVGGVGVVAIMMISVTERTREIGVRKALGATRREIMFQFLVEAATLTLVGCVIGIGLGALISWGIRSFTPLPAAIPLLSVIGAIISSILTGVLFGLYPASKASRLDPVEALRYE